MVIAFLKKYWIQIAVTIIGTIAGFLYWKYVGCSSGTCPITSKWHLTALYGGGIGYLIGGLLTKKES